MNRRHMLIGAVGTLAALFTAGSASARIPAQVPVGAEAGPEIEAVKRGGRGKHRGWSRGRGHAYGRRRKFGW
ncbi:MAG: hypothetical protein LCH61_02225 [Proteobacteria bacterium]|nr:hypothetical protein [Pseudomonadota bacterium]